MPRKPYPDGTRVIVKATGDHGRIASRLPRQFRYRVKRFQKTTDRRPATEHAAPAAEFDHDELHLGMSARAQTRADQMLQDSLYLYDAAETAAKRAQKVAIRDNSGNSHHSITEAARWVDAIDNAL